MSKNKKVLLIVGIVLVVLLAVALAALWLFGFQERLQEEKKPTGDMTYTVLVKNSSDTPMEGIGVYIYEDEKQGELIWFDKTDAKGKMSFTAPYSEEYVAVLGDVPTGYAAQKQYPITSEVTEIVLSLGVMSEEDMKNLSYKLGDLMMDFTIVDTEGTEYTLSELLKTKKAVVLNFWSLDCVPCQEEFPFMQEAYEKYKDDLEILAMNPEDLDEKAIAKFKKELGLTFPMAQVDALWKQMMDLTAYPTTVVIDRFGNIVLIHKGAIDSADTFEQLFAYFTADDYEAKAIESIYEIVEEEEGSEDNPSIPTDSEFEVTLEPGETYYVNLYKITEMMYLTVKGEGDFILTYKGKEYKPNNNGSLTITITSEGPSTPVELKIQNLSDKKQTYYFSKSFPKGSSANPYRLSLGEFDISTSAGNEKGTFGTYTAEKSGTLTVRCLRSSVSKYGFYLYNLRSYAMRNADEDGKTDEDGYLYVSVQVKKGDQIQFSVAVARDDSNSIPSGSFRFELMLKEGDGEEEEKKTLPTQSYTITVTDENGKAVSGVTVNIKGDFTYQPPESEEPTEPTESEEEEISNEVKVDKSVVTDDTGVIKTDLVPGPYIVTVSVPAGYKLGKTEYELTDKITSLDIKLQTLKQLNYTVKVVDPNSKPVQNVVVLMSSSGSSVYGNTDAKGVYKIKQLEGDYTVSLYGGIPEGYASPKESFTFAEGKTSMTIKLIYKPGSEKNPIKINGEFPFYTGALESGKSEYYTVTGAGGMTLRILDENAEVIYNGTTYKAVEGMVTVEFPEGNEAISLIIRNKGTDPKSFRVNVGYPLGHKKNPVTLDKAYTYITTRGLNKGETVYYSLVDVAGKALIISDPDAAIIYGGKTYTATDGAVTVELGEEKNPLVAFCNQSSEQMEKYSVRVGYPWGSENNPVTVSNKTTITTRTLSAGEGVWYKMSGVAAMELTIADENAKVIYDGVTYEAVDGVVNVQLKKDAEPATVCFVNGGAVGEGYTVKLQYPLGSRQNPIVLKGVFRTFDTVSIPAGETVFYKIKDVAGATASVAADAMLSWNGTEAQSVTIPESAEVVSGLLSITNNAQDASGYTVTVAFNEVGTRQNPEVYTSGQVKKTLEADDADGYYYSMTAPQSGTMTVTLAKVRGYLENTTGDFDVILYRNGTAATPKMTDNMVEGEGSNAVSIQVAQGDDVRILLIATAAGDGTVPSKKIAFTAAVTAGTAPTDDVNEDAYVNPGEPYVEADDPNGKEDATEFVEPPEVIEEEGGEAQFLTYTVTVTDYTGKAMGNVIVQLFSGGKKIDGGMTNAKGVFYTLQTPGDYTVELSFSSSGCYYEEATALLTPSVTTLKIPVTSVLPTEGGTHWATFQYQTVGLGGTYVAMQSNVVNYYGFYPEEQGTYRFQISDPSAKISYWGTGAPNDLTENTLDYTGNAFTLSIGESMIGGTHFIGVTDVEDGILVITRLGDAQFDVNELPWVSYTPAVAPAAVTGLPANGTLKRIDVTAKTGVKLVYNDKDKYYHIGSSTGPILYVQLAADKNGNVPPYIHINAMVGGVNENMATAFRWADYDDKGNYIKEDYTDVMRACCDYAELNDYGVYPVTKDVMYMIQQCGDYMGWWDPENENHKVVFGEVKGINLEIAWMFACCYFD